MSAFVGSWVNSFGSLMTLDSSGGGEYLYGHYSSTTGSTGTYWVVGYGSTAIPTQQNGIGVALTIFWRSTAGPPSDNSWHWVSGLGGQLILQSNNIPNIVLNHDLVATMALSGLAGVGSYVDKLTYVPYTTLAAPKAPQKQPKAEGALTDPIEGSWGCTTQNITISLVMQDPTIGFLTGTLFLNGSAFDSVGFADTYAQGQTPFEGLSFSLSLGNGTFMAFSGSLNLNTGSLYLLQQTSTGTAVSAQYVQTSAQGLYFVRS